MPRIIVAVIVVVTVGVSIGINIARFPSVGNMADRSPKASPAPAPVLPVLPAAKHNDVVDLSDYAPPSTRNATSSNRLQRDMTPANPTQPSSSQGASIDRSPAPPAEQTPVHFVSESTPPASDALPEHEPAPYDHNGPPPWPPTPIDGQQPSQPVVPDAFSSNEPSSNYIKILGDPITFGPAPPTPTDTHSEVSGSFDVPNTVTPIAPPADSSSRISHTATLWPAEMVPTAKLTHCPAVAEEKPPANLPVTNKPNEWEEHRPLVPINWVDPPSDYHRDTPRTADDRFEPFPPPVPASPSLLSSNHFRWPDLSHNTYPSTGQ